MSTDQRIALLQAQIEAARNGYPEDFARWKQKTSTALRLALGDDHKSVAQFDLIRYSLSVTSSSTPKSAHERARAGGVMQGVAILESAVFELETRRDLGEASPSTAAFPASPVGGPIFVVHGHDTDTLNEVVLTLQRLTGEAPIVLHEQADGGRTIIEKFEDHASSASFAVVLLTADDLGRAVGDQSEQARARQNVVLEAGYFIGKLGRSRVALLYEAGVELPSDLSGVLFVELDGDGAWRYRLGKELREADVDADLNNL